MKFNPQPKPLPTPKKKKQFIKRSGAIKKSDKNFPLPPLSRVVHPKASRGQIENLLDRVFSRWTRLKNADEFGFVKCFTCDNVFHWKELDNGHYISRRNRSTRWFPPNCNPQCKECNQHKRGNLVVYAERLGPIIVEDITRKSREIARFSIGDLLWMIADYEKRLQPFKLFLL